jgi:heme oxygenase (mycobilin-producing)
MPIAIDAFEVPPEAGDAFAAAWTPRRAGGLLHRALREDADLRFVAVTSVEDAGGWAPAHAEVFASHSALYEVAHEDGEPDGADGVILINAFEVPDGEDERFLGPWRGARDVLAEQRGYLGTRLHRALGDADFRFVNVARWSSPLMFFRALQVPAFASASEAIAFVSHPALYQVVRSG